jgi:hypothetical protein
MPADKRKAVLAVKAAQRVAHKPLDAAAVDDKRALFDARGVLQNIGDSVFRVQRDEHYVAQRQRLPDQLFVEDPFAFCAPHHRFIAVKAEDKVAGARLHGFGHRPADQPQSNYGNIH